MNKNSIGVLLVLGTVAVSSLGALGAGARREIQLPQAVRDAVQRSYPQATIRGTERGTLALKVYEVAVQDGARKLELIVAQDGTVVAVENHIAQSELPPAVQQTLAQAAGSAKVTDIDRVERRAKSGVVPLAQPQILYEAEWRKDGREIEIGIASDGSLVNQGDDDEDGDEDGDGDDEDDDGDGEDDEG